MAEISLPDKIKIIRQMRYDYDCFQGYEDVPVEYTFRDFVKSQFKNIAEQYLQANKNWQKFCRTYQYRGSLNIQNIQRSE
jgi:hypothetical protein